MNISVLCITTSYFVFNYILVHCYHLYDNLKKLDITVLYTNIRKFKVQWQYCVLIMRIFKVQWQYCVLIMRIFKVWCSSLVAHFHTAFIHLEVILSSSQAYTVYRFHLYVSDAKKQGSAFNMFTYSFISLAFVIEQRLLYWIIQLGYVM
jgi:hypothetical protein